MSKAVIMFDMPKCCYECPCCYYSKDACQVDMHELEEEAGKERPPWCPIWEVLEETNTKNILLK